MKVVVVVVVVTVRVIVIITYTANCKNYSTKHMKTIASSFYSNFKFYTFILQIL